MAFCVVGGCLCVCWDIYVTPFPNYLQLNFFLFELPEWPGADASSEEFESGVGTNGSH